jgi:molybdopterin synthase catalytic subunit
MSKHKNSFIEGPISPEFIAQSIAKHQHKTDIGAHNIFLGQVRKDEINGSHVEAIEYTTYREMAEEKLAVIREETFAQYELTCMHIYHSIGLVKTGEICLFVFTSSKHRKIAFEACEILVERIKNEVPIWGKEIMAKEEYQWKENK